MTLIHGHEQYSPCSPMNAEILKFVPRPGDGEFLNRPVGELPFAMHVSDVRPLSDRTIRGVGRQITSLVEVSDSLGIFEKPSRFVHREIEPEQQRYDIAVAMMPPLATRVKGFNTSFAREVAAAGMPAVLTGTNQTRGHSLLHDTQATLEVLNFFDRQAGRCYRPDTSIDYGYSMGAMKDSAKLALAGFFGREVALSLQVDPCVAERLRQRSLIKPALAGYFLRDAAEVPRITIKNAAEEGWLRTAGRLRQWCGTASADPRFLLNTADKWRTIITGEAGTFIGGIPREQAMVIHAFTKSRFNDCTVFEEQLANRPFARLIRQDGYHLSAASPRVTKNVVDDLKTAQELLRQGAPKTELVRALARPILSRRPSTSFASAA